MDPSWTSTTLDLLLQGLKKKHIWMKKIQRNETSIYKNERTFEKIDGHMVRHKERPMRRQRHVTSWRGVFMKVLRLKEEDY